MVLKKCYFRSMNAQNVTNLIVELLHNNDCVTIPQFGAFVVNPSGAQVDFAKNRFTPPGKQVSFNKKIQNNDGLLASEIAKKDGISYEDAVEYLKAFVQLVENELKSKKIYDFHNIGSIFLTADNRIKFEPELSASFHEFGLEPFHLKPIDHLPYLKKEELLIPSSMHHIHENVAARTGTNWNRVGLAIAAIPFFLYLAWVPTSSGLFNESKQFELSNLNPFKATPCVEYNQRPAGLRELDLDVAEYLHEDFDENNYKFSVAETSKVEVEITDISTFKLQYQIIGGCFGSKKNANKLIRQMKKRGYHAEILDLKNGLYRVSLGGFANQTEARYFLREVKANDIQSAWLLRK